MQSAIRTLYVSGLILVSLIGCSSPFTLAGFLDRGAEPAGPLDQPPPPDGTVLWEESFESVAPGTPANGVGLLSLSDPNTDSAVASWFGENVLGMGDDNPAGHTYAHAMILPEIMTQATVEYEICQLTDQLWSHFELWDSNFDVIVALYLDDVGDLYYTDSSATDQFIANIPQDEFRRIHLSVDIETQQFDISLANVLVANDIALTNPGVDLMFVEFRTSHTGAGGLLLMDDLRVVSYD